GFEGGEVRLWNPPGAVDALPRVLKTFLPSGEGGSDAAGEPGQSRHARYYFEQVPWGQVPPFLMQLAGEPGDRLRASYAGRVLALRQAGSARDLIYRGQFPE